MKKRLRRHTAEDGYILLWVLIMVLVISISLAIAAPRIATEIRRDKELEYYHRGQQYARAIRLYYNKTGHFPTEIAQLEKTNDIRFLRKRYRDPITGAAEWHLIHQGQAKSQLMGLFGQPYSGQIPGGTAAGTPIGLVALNAAAQNGGVNTGGSGRGNSSGSSGFSSGGGFGSSGVSGGNSSNSSSATSQVSSGSSASTDGLGTLTPFGAGIVGVSSNSKKESIRVYKKQTHYDQWEFVYNPAEDGIGGGVLPGMNTPGVVAAPLTGATGGVSVDPTLGAAAPPTAPPPVTLPTSQE